MLEMIKLAVRLRIDVEFTDGCYLAICPLLNVVSQGATPSQAVERAKEEIVALIEHCVEHDVLDEMIDRRIRSDRPSRQQDRSQRKDEMDQPVWISIDLPMEVARAFTSAA